LALSCLRDEFKKRRVTLLKGEGRFLKKALISHRCAAGPSFSGRREKGIV
jgi:hypothetical protein